MRPIQEAFIELLAEGLSKSEACRRLSLGRSQPGYWAQMSPEFEEAYRPYRGMLQKRCISIDVVHELSELLIAEGYVDESYVEDLQSTLAKFLMRIGALQFEKAKGVIGRASRPMAERRQIVDDYLKLKRSDAGTTHRLGLYLVEHRVSSSQICRWARQFYGKNALAVGPYQPGVTRRKVRDFINLYGIESPRPARFVAEQLGINLYTVREYLRLLARDGEIKRVGIGARVYYAPA